MRATGRFQWWCLSLVPEMIPEVFDCEGSVFSRRDFLWLGSGLTISTSLLGCRPIPSVPASFKHGVASGDPAANSVILWTRATPEADAPPEAVVEVGFEVAADPSFQRIVRSGTAATTARRDHTVKIEAAALKPDTLYWYRFKVSDKVSEVGRTRTLPATTASPDKLKLAVFSCSSWDFGYFHAYDAATKVLDIDFALHLGDYLYEYPKNTYGTVREAVPDGELLQLADYRQRYACYRTDANLQAIHAALPFICVWDDHEIANNAWRTGAENHDSKTEGDYKTRVQMALRAYFEWMPVRTPVNSFSIYRGFDFGDLASLHMLDTRFIGRDQQLDYANYADADSRQFDYERFQSDLTAFDRSLLGADQRAWLQERVTQSRARWQLLGQQILMGRYWLPAPVVLGQISFQDFVKQARQNSNVAPPSVPFVPFNLDAWDGYHAERARVFRWMQASDSRFIVLAGDTHNAWASTLRTDTGEQVGIEFGTQSVTSGGLEEHLKLTPKAVRQMEKDLVATMKDLHYMNGGDRGFMTLALDRDQAETEWHFVSDVGISSYRMLSQRHTRLKTNHTDLAVSRF